MKKFLILFALIGIVSSCNEYQKAVKSEDVTVKYKAAAKQFEKGKYDKAIRLFEQIAPSYKGKPDAERLFYMLSVSYYKTKQFYLSGYQFESFASSYPKSEKMEEAAFLGAKSFSMLSPVYSLDQSETEKAIDKLQNFIDSFPNSTLLPEANKLVKELKNKIEQKVFENAKQYYTISDFKSAQVALTNFIDDFPGTTYKEDALFYKFDAAYKLAINSVPSKMKDRLVVAQTDYLGLVKFKPETKYKKQIEVMKTRIETDLKQYSNK